MVSNVAPINVKLRVVVHMYQLVNEGIFHVLFIDKAVLAEKDSVLRTEATCELLVARRAQDMSGSDPVRNESQLFDHENHSGAYKPERRQ